MPSLSIEDLQKIYNDTMAQASPRFDGYPLMDSPDKIIVIVGLYLFVVWQGPKWMASRKPFDLKYTIITYNFAMVFLSLHIFLSAVYLLRSAGGYTAIFIPIKDSNIENLVRRHGDFGWLFFISKIIETLDTIFFILRKKNSHITFLHVYHHATMIIITWLGAKFLPGGSNALYPLVNCLIHTFMYTYYALSACGPSMAKYLWWKKYMTRMQITQFLIFLFQGVIDKIYDNPMPKVFTYLVYTYVLTLLILFVNFYVKSYKRPPSQKPITKYNGTAHGTAQNGEVISNGNSHKID